MSRQKAFLEEHQIKAELSEQRRRFLEKQRRIQLRSKEVARLNELHPSKLQQLSKELYEHLEPKKSIYFEIAYSDHAKLRLGFDDLTQIRAHLAEHFPLWHFRQSKHPLMHNRRFRLCIGPFRLPYGELVVKATPIS